MSTSSSPPARPRSRTSSSRRRAAVPRAAQRALDFGCGVGRLTRALGTRFGSALGVDISAGMVEQARRLNEAFPACEFCVNAAPDLGQLEAESFDFVYSSIALQHLPTVPEIERYVTEFLRVARPDGLVVFGIPHHIPSLCSFQPRRRTVCAPSSRWACRSSGCCGGRR